MPPLSNATNSRRDRKRVSQFGPCLDSMHFHPPTRLRVEDPGRECPMRTECARRHEGHGREAGTVDEHMDLRQVSTRTDRRRRMLSEDRREAASVVTPGSESPGRAEARTPRSYTAAARAEQQPRICQLIPERRWTLALWFLVTATVLVGHAALDATYHAANLQLSAIDLSPLTFQARPNLACSTTSLALLSAAGYAGLIVGLRVIKLTTIEDATGSGTTSSWPAVSEASPPCRDSIARFNPAYSEPVNGAALRRGTWLGLLSHGCSYSPRLAHGLGWKSGHLVVPS